MIRDVGIEDGTPSPRAVVIGIDDARPITAVGGAGAGADAAGERGDEERDEGETGEEPVHGDRRAGKGGGVPPISLGTTAEDCSKVPSLGPWTGDIPGGTDPSLDTSPTVHCSKGRLRIN